MASVLITGSSGLIGRRLLQKLDPNRYETVYCLIRRPNGTSPPVSRGLNVEFVNGDIRDSGSYAHCLASTDTVIHLAAVTGKRPPWEYFSVNGDGTKTLLRECEGAGVRKFLHVSSIAVKYSDKSRYYYAQSKELAESAVRESGLDYTIVRPTIVLGAGSPIWQGLSKLARMPVTPIFGSGKSIFQPIYIDDLIACLLFILAGDLFQKNTVEIGGPEPITVENLLARIRFLYYANELRTLHVPLRPLLSCLSLLEKGFYSILPMTVGQLAAFCNDGLVESNEVFEQHRKSMRGIDEMLRIIREHEERGGRPPQS